MKEVDFKGMAHEIWAMAQLLPGEGIRNGVSRIEDLLIVNFTGSAKIKTLKDQIRKLKATAEYKKEYITSLEESNKYLSGLVERLVDDFDRMGKQGG